jgi:hypothetical protein
MFNTSVGAGAVGAGAASSYGSGSDQMMWLLAAPCGSGSSTLKGTVDVGYWLLEKLELVL